MGELLGTPLRVYRRDARRYFIHLFLSLSVWVALSGSHAWSAEGSSSPTPPPSSNSSAVGRLCKDIVRLTRGAFLGIWDVEFLDRPTDARAEMPQEVVGDQPGRFVYAETRYIKFLRDRAHLSPMQVDRIIHQLKRLFEEAVQEVGLQWNQVGVDYKSIKLRFSDLDATKLGLALTITRARFDKFLRDQFPGDPKFARPGAAEILESLGVNYSPIGVGMGNTMKQAAIAARLLYLRTGAPVDPINAYESFRSAIAAEVKALDKMIGAIIQRIENSFPAEAAAQMIQTLRGQKVMGTGLTEILRRYNTPEAVSMELKRIYDLAEPPSKEFSAALIEVYQAVRLFEPPLEYLADETVNIVQYKTDAEGLLVPVMNLPHVKFSSTAELFGAADFVVSADIRGVGAFHSTVLQSQIRGASEKAEEDIDALVESLTYGESIDRLRALINDSRRAMRVAFASKDSDPKPLLEMASKTSGDELIQVYQGLYDDNKLAQLVHASTADMRLTIVNLGAFRIQGAGISESQMNELRHLGETAAKHISQTIERAPGGSRAFSDQFRFIVEIRPTNMDAKKADVLIYHAPLPANWSQAQKDTVKAAISSLRQGMQDRGIPEHSLSEIGNFSAFPLPTPTP